MNLLKATVLAVLGMPAAALADAQVPPASVPDAPTKSIVQSVRDSQIVLTPPGGTRQTVRARVLLSMPAGEYSAEEAYLLDLWAYEMRRQERLASLQAAPAAPPPAPEVAPAPRAWHPSVGVGVGSYGSSVNFGFSNYPYPYQHPFWGWRPYW